MRHDAGPPKWKSLQHKEEYMSSPLGDPRAEDCQWCGQRKDFHEHLSTGHLTEARICQCDDPEGEVHR